LSKKSSWQVRLGPTEWHRFTYERPAGDQLQLIGSVKRGQQVGALGMIENNQYVQVVGDHITHLNTSQIKRAVGNAKPVEHVSAFQAGERTTPQAAPPPIVIVKKRRTFAPA